MTNEEQGLTKKRRRRRRRAPRSAGPASTSPAGNTSETTAKPQPGPTGQSGDSRDSQSSPSSSASASGSGSNSGSGSRRRRRHNRPHGSSQGGPKAGSGSSGNSGKDSGGKKGYRRAHKNKKSGQQSAQRPRRDNRKRSPMHTRTETSAGGLVVSGLAESVTETGEVDLSTVYAALIGRLDRRGRLLWSMPKGHVESDEAHDVTAEREVWEETGIHGEVFAHLGKIDYWFVSDGVRIHKTVHHHLLRFVDGWLNDEDPEVTEVAWVPVSELIEHLAYADERKLARTAHDLLPDLARAEKDAGRITPR